MSVPDIGYPFLTLLALSLLFARAWLPALLAIGAALQGSAVLLIHGVAGGYGLPAYNAVGLTCCAYLAIRVLRTPWSWQYWRPPLQERFMLGFTAVACVGAGLLPLAFAGEPVFSPLHREGFDGAMEPLRLTRSNLAQVFNLLLNAGVMLYLWDEARRRPQLPRYLLGGLTAAIVLVVAASGYERLAMHGELPRLFEFWQSNPGYVQVPYSNSMQFVGFGVPFSEPSFAAAFLVPALVGTVALWLHSRSWVWPFVGSLVLLGALMNTISSTGWVASAIGIAVVAGAKLVNGWRHAWEVRRTSSSTRVTSLCVLLAGCTAYWLYFASPYSSSIQDAAAVVVLDKVTTTSYRNRATANEKAVELLVDSHGLGVGMGSHRASSFAASIGAGTGVVGLGLFAALLAAILRPYLLARSLSLAQVFAGTAVSAATLAVVIGVPDVNAPFYWIYVFVAARLRPEAPAAKFALGERAQTCPPND